MKTTLRFFFFLMLVTALTGPFESLAVKHNILVGNYYFNPVAVNVSVGDTIHWQWVAGSHTTTSSAIPAGASPWDHLITTGNRTYDYPVLVSGTYNYVCTPHVGMNMIGSFTATPVGTGEISDLNFSIFPNPSKGVFKIETGNSSLTEGEITLIDLTGKVISTRNLTGSDAITFDLSGFPKGYYFIRLKSGAVTSVRRILIAD